MLHDPPRPPYAPLDTEPFLTLPPLRRVTPLAGAADPAGAARPANPAAAPATPPVQLADRLGVLAEIAALRREQVEKWGHTPDKDALLPLAHLPREAKDLLAAAVDDIQFHRGGPAFAEKRTRIRKRLLKAAAFLIAAIDRLDIEPDDSADWPTF